MLIVKSQSQSSTLKHRIISVTSCHEVVPLLNDGGKIFAVDCRTFGAETFRGSSYVHTIHLQQESGDDHPRHIYVENMSGKTVQSYHSSFEGEL